MYSMFFTLTVCPENLWRRDQAASAVLLEEERRGPAKHLGRVQEGRSGLQGQGKKSWHFTLSAGSLSLVILMKGRVS